MRMRAGMVSLLASALIMCMLCACVANSSVSGSDQDGTSPESSASSSAAQNMPAVASSSASSPNSESASSSADADDVVEVTFPYTTTAGNPIELTLAVPASWEYNGYSTFTDASTELKCLEVAAVYEIADPADPVSDDMLAPFQTTVEGLDQSDMFYGTSNAAGRPVEYFRTSSVPDGADGTFTWYTFFTFSYDDQYVYQLHFYTTDEKANISAFFNVIASAHAES